MKCVIVRPALPPPSPPPVSKPHVPTRSRLLVPFSFHQPFSGSERGAICRRTFLYLTAFTSISPGLIELLPDQVKPTGWIYWVCRRAGGFFSLLSFLFISHAASGRPHESTFVSCLDIRYRNNHY
ncbi:hypothetical protein BJX99DRAFT_47395 [Aspergillus californicus]